MSVDIQRVKEYNRQLRECKEKSNKIMAEMQFNREEIKRLCGKLTEQLGIEVTPENVVQIYKEREAKIEETLNIGEGILNRIKAEESSIERRLDGQSTVNQSTINQNIMFNSVGNNDIIQENEQLQEHGQMNNTYYGMPQANNVETVNGSQPIQPIFRAQ